MHGKGIKSWNPVNTGTAQGLRGGIDRSPQMRKNIDLRSNKESEGYLLNPGPYTTSCLNTVWEELSRWSHVKEDLPSERPTTSEVK